jgi:hypothetical protein
MTAPPGAADVGVRLGATEAVIGLLAVGSGGAEIVIVWRGLPAPSVGPSVPGKIGLVAGKGAAANEAVGVVATAGGCWRGGNRPL